MTKQKISSRVVRARSLAIYELEGFIGYICTIDPELEPHQSIQLAAFILNDLPKLFQQNPTLVDRIKEIATDIKTKRRNPNN